MNKLDMDTAIVTAIVEKSKFTATKKMQMLAILQPSYHESGKIEGITSIDGSAIHCEFCKSMKAAAEKDSTVVCGGCYITALDNLYKGMTARHWLNQLILSETLYTVEQLKAVYIGTEYIRINADGDMRNATQARNVLRLAKAHKSNRVSIWFKNLPAMKEAIEKEGKPRNVRIIYSACMLNDESAAAMMEKYDWIDNVFIVYVDKADTVQAIESGACACNGQKCKDCGFKCYAARGWEKGKIIAECLRGVNKERRAALKKAIQARASK